MHCLALRRNLVEKYPWLSGAIYRAFKVAKDEALKELTLTNVSRVSLPWLTESVTRAKDLLGRRFWSYGFPDNERELQAMMRYAHECGLVNQEMPASCLFDRVTLALAD
jgi:4,5-dihydroxyphthalate decarboxylase